MGRTTVYNNITTKEKIDNINPENISLVNDFLDYLRSVGRAETTIKGYWSDLMVFFCWCEDELNNKYFVDLTKREIARFQNHALNVWGWSSNRLRRVKSSLSSLSNFIANILDDEIENYKPIVRKIENPPTQTVRDKTVYTDEEITSLLNTLTSSGLIEKACFVALAAYSGRRKAELCRFKVSDFDDDKLICGGALYKSSPIKTKGRGGGKYIPCYVLAKKFKPYLDAWMQYREQKGIKSVWLFPSSLDQDEHITTRTVDGWYDSFTAITGKDFYIHSLRHAFTTSLAKSGIPDNVIQTLVAWESADMVRLYDDTPKDEMIAEYFKDGDIVQKEVKTISEL